MIYRDEARQEEIREKARALIVRLRARGYYASAAEDPGFLDVFIEELTASDVPPTTHDLGEV